MRSVVIVAAAFLAVMAGSLIALIQELGTSSLDLAGPSVLTSSLSPTPTVTIVPSSPSSPSSPSPAETPKPTARSTPAARPETWQYTVVPNDSLSLIARRYGTTVDEMLRLNPEYRPNRDRVEVGAVLVVPCTAAAVGDDRC